LKCVKREIRIGTTNCLQNWLIDCLICNLPFCGKDSDNISNSYGFQMYLWTTKKSCKINDAIFKNHNFSDRLKMVGQVIISNIPKFLCEFTQKQFYQLAPANQFIIQYLCSSTAHSCQIIKKINWMFINQAVKKKSQF
jgi:hypothetical protein